MKISTLFAIGLVVYLAVVPKGAAFTFLDSDTPIDWAELTIVQLHGLDPNVFTTVNASMIALIPELSFHGFTAEQIAAMNPEAFAAFSPGAAAKIPTYAWTGLTSSGIIYLPPNVFSSFKIDDIAAIPATALMAMTADQFAVIVQRRDRFLCAGLASSSEKLSLLKPELFSVMDSACISLTGTNGWREVSTAQTSRLNASAVIGFLPDQISALSPEAFAALTRDAIAALGAPYNIYRPCSGITAAHAALLTEEKLEVISPMCVYLTDSTTWSYLSSEQFESLNPDAFGGLREDHIMHIRPFVWAALQPRQAALMSPKACAAFSFESVDQIRLDSFFEFGKACGYFLTADAVYGVSPAHVRLFSSFPFLRVDGLSDEAFNSLGIEQFISFHSEQIYYISPEQIDLLLQDDTKKRLLFSTWSIKQLSVPNPSTVAAFREWALKNAEIQGIQRDISQIDSNHCTWVHLALATKISATSPTLNQLIPSLVNSSHCLLGLQTAWAPAITQATLEHLQGSISVFLSPELLAAFSTAQLHSLFKSESAVSGLTKEAWEAIALDKIKAMTPDEFAVVSPYVVSKLSCDQLMVLTPKQLSMTSPETVAMYRLMILSPPCNGTLPPSLVESAPAATETPHDSNFNHDAHSLPVTFYVFVGAILVGFLFVVALIVFTLITNTKAEVKAALEDRRMFEPVQTARRSTRAGDNELLI